MTNYQMRRREIALREYCKDNNQYTEPTDMRFLDWYINIFMIDEQYQDMVLQALGKEKEFSIK